MLLRGYSTPLAQSLGLFLGFFGVPATGKAFAAFAVVLLPVGFDLAPRFILFRFQAVAITQKAGTGVLKLTVKISLHLRNGFLDLALDLTGNLPDLLPFMGQFRKAGLRVWIFTQPQYWPSLLLAR